MADETKAHACAMCKGTGAVWSGLFQTTCLGCNGTGKAKATQIAFVEQARAAFVQRHGRTPDEAIAEIQATMRGIVSMIQPMIQAAITQWQVIWEEQLYPFFHNAYLNAGAPYGDDQPGMFRWLREVVENKEA